MLFAFTDVVTKEVVKEVVNADIDIHFWTVTLWVILGAMVTGAGGVAMLAITMYGKIIAKIQEVFPAVAAKVEKVDSAVKEVNAAKVEAIAAKDESKDYIKTTANELGTVIGKQVGKQIGTDAKAVAAVLADATVKQNIVTNEKLERIANAVHGAGEKDGDGGICLTAKVREHGEILAALKKDHDELKDRVIHLEMAATESLNILRELRPAST